MTTKTAASGIRTSETRGREDPSVRRTHGTVAGRRRRWASWGPMDTRTSLIAELWFESEPQLDQAQLAALGAGLASADVPPSSAQTWDWDEAGDVVARCTHSLVIAEFRGPF